MQTCTNTWCEGYIFTYIRSLDPEVCQSYRCGISHKHTKYTSVAKYTELFSVKSTVKLLYAVLWIIFTYKKIHL